MHDDNSLFGDDMRLGNPDELLVVLLLNNKIRINFSFLSVDIDNLYLILIQYVKIIVFPVEEWEDSYSFEFDVVK